jgi:tight adherence protein B
MSALALAASAGIACAMAAVSLASARVIAVAYSRYRERYIDRSARELGGMFLFVEPRAVLVLNGAALLAGVLGGLAVAGPVLALLLGVAGFAAPQLAVSLVRSRRRAAFERQLPDALQSVAAALRAGLTFQQAAEQLARDTPAPLGQELALFGREVRLGLPVEDALLALAERVRSEDLELTVTAVNIARQLGGNLGEILETIAATIRERFRLEGKVRALTAQGKLQGAIVAALPPLLALVMDHLRPDLVRPMLAHAFGWVLVAAVALMEAVGIVLIRKIVRIEV